MRTESTTSEDQPASLTVEVAPRSPWRIVAVEALAGFLVAFADGLTVVQQQSEWML